MTKSIKQLALEIEKAGSPEAYVKQQMQKQSFTVTRKNVADLSKKELSAYKQALKKEASEKHKLQQEAWQGYKAYNIVHLGDDIYWNDQDVCDKFDCDDRHVRMQENAIPDFKNPQALAAWLGVSMPQLRGLTYHRECAESIKYRHFTIEKRSGGMRSIWAPNHELKQVQRQILDEILSSLLVHDASHGFMQGRSIFSNALRHTDAKIVVKMDLKDFFPTISFKRVKGLFRKAGYQEQIATLLALLCTEAPRKIIERDGKKYFIALGERCLPQGAPTSPAISNVVCLRLDRRLQGLAESLGYRYTRYADDLTFSQLNDCKKPMSIGALKAAIKNIIESEGFVLHTEKTRITYPHRSQQVTGLVVNGKGLPRVPRKTKRHLRAAIHNLQQGKPLQDGESLEQLKGYAAFIAMSDPKTGQEMLAKLNECQLSLPEST